MMGDAEWTARAIDVLARASAMMNADGSEAVVAQALRNEYERGAREMREHAARTCEERAQQLVDIGDYDNLAPGYRSAAERIRALPLPHDQEREPTPEEVAALLREAKNEGAREMRERAALRIIEAETLLPVSPRRHSVVNNLARLADLVRALPYDQERDDVNT